MLGHHSSPQSHRNYFTAMHPTILLLPLLLTLALAVCRNPPSDKCRFRFCNLDIPTRLTNASEPRIFLRDPKFASPPFLCIFEKKKIKPVISYIEGPALVQPFVRKGAPVPEKIRIDKYRPAGLQFVFQKRFLGLRQIKFPLLPSRFGLAIREPFGNQLDFLDFTCVTLPITEFAIVNRDGSLTQGNGRGNKKSCVRFVTVVARILIELTWDSSDDFDVAVTEPDGTVINKDSTKSPRAGLIRNNGVDMCGKVIANREQIQWNVRKVVLPLSGKYLVRVRHTKNCGLGKTKWSLSVVINGENVLFKEGFSNNRNKQVLSSMFRFLKR